MSQAHPEHAGFTPEERYKIDVLTTIAHESSTNHVALLVFEAPAWARAWLLELVDDGVIALVRGESAAAACALTDPSAWLSHEEAATVLSPAGDADEVWAVTLPAGELLEREPARLFRYASGDRRAVRCR